MAKRNSKVTSYRRYPWLNIGTILFGAIFIYMVITVIMYMTAKHITTYEVISGSISGNYRYTALSMKHEEIEKADYSGYVTYYARSGAKTGSGSTVCTIQNQPDQVISDVELTDVDYRNIKNLAKSFVLNYSPSVYQQIYTTKADLDTYLVQSTIDDEQTDVGDPRTSMSAPDSGFVVYQTDGMENLSEADLSADLFNQSSYQAENLRQGDQVALGDPVYKLVTGEDWYLYFPLSDDLVTQLTGRDSIRFRFLKDDTTFSAAFSIVEGQDGAYGKITLKNSLVRYVTERFLDIELLMDSQNGLKVPASSIAHEQFYKIPVDYAEENESNNAEVYLNRETFRGDGSSSTSRVTARVYGVIKEEKKRYYLVAPDLLADGDYLQKSDTAEKIQIMGDDLVEVEGVYNINKGYAVFRIVNVIDANEEFCVVSPNDTYGLAAHDFIALDATTVTHDDIVY